MKNYHKGNDRFGKGKDFKRDFKKPEFSRGPSSDRFEMHRAVCSTCGNDCEVPFRPTSGKPVYCNKCFKSVRNSEGDRYEERNSYQKNTDYSKHDNERRSGSMDEQLKRQFETLNWKLDKILKILTPVVPLVVAKVENTKKDVVVLKPKKKKSVIEKTSV